MGGKGSRCVVLTTLSPSCADCQEILDLQSPGTQRACEAWQGLVTVVIATTTTTTSTTAAAAATTTPTTSATCAIVCHEPCPVLPLPSMLPILQLLPPILKALSSPPVSFHQTLLPNSSSICTRPLLSVVWYVGFLQVSCSCILWKCPARSAFNYFGFMIHCLKFVFKPWFPYTIFLN
jgi:hypothetical protein